MRFMVFTTFFNYECALFLKKKKGGSFDQPLLQCLGIRYWDEAGRILQIPVLYQKKSASLEPALNVQAFFLDCLADYFHYHGGGLRLSVLPLPVWHGALCVQEHWWENAATSCNAKG